MTQSTDKKKISVLIDGRDEVARFDMPTGLASIARPIKTGAARPAFDKKQTFKGSSITLSGISLDDHDLAVLLSFVVLAEQQTRLLPSKSVVGLLRTPDGIAANLAEDLDVAVVNTTYSRVCRILDVKECGSANTAIWNSLRRAASIVVEASVGNEKAITHLVQPSKSKDKTLLVALSFRLTRALIGNSSYGAIEMQIFRKLPRGTARILYVWLMSWYGGAAGTRIVGVDTLVGRVWDEPLKKLSAVTIKDRRRVVRNSLRHITEASDGRLSAEIRDGMAIVTRKAR